MYLMMEYMEHNYGKTELLNISPTANRSRITVLYFVKLNAIKALWTLNGKNEVIRTCDNSKILLFVCLLQVVY